MRRKLERLIVGPVVVLLVVLISVSGRAEAAEVTETITISVPVEGLVTVGGGLAVRVVGERAGRAAFVVGLYQTLGSKTQRGGVIRDIKKHIRALQAIRIVLKEHANRVRTGR